MDYGTSYNAPVNPLAWMDEGICSEIDPDMWFTDDDADAKSICAICPVRFECAAYALRTPGLVGVWGGLNTEERWAVKRERRQLASA